MVELERIVETLEGSLDPKLSTFFVYAKIEVILVFEFQQQPTQSLLDQLIRLSLHLLDFLDLVAELTLIEILVQQLKQLLNGYDFLFGEKLQMPRDFLALAFLPEREQEYFAHDA